MPTYKKLATKKIKAKDLPFYRPIDRLVLQIWRKRRAVAPFLGAVFVILLIYGGLWFYADRYEAGASTLLLKGDLAQLVEKYPRSQAAVIARVKLGKKAIDEQKWEEAIPWYRAVAENQNAAPLLRVNALQNLSFVYLKKGETAKSIELLEKASRDPKNPAPDYSELLLAFTYEKKGEGDKARELYQSLSEGAKNPMIQKEAKEKIGKKDEVEKTDKTEKSEGVKKE